MVQTSICEVSTDVEGKKINKGFDHERKKGMDCKRLSCRGLVGSILLLAISMKTFIVYTAFDWRGVG